MANECPLMIARCLSTASVADRNQALMAKKEDKIKKLLEEEKAAREFHANPLPKGEWIRIHRFLFGSRSV